MSLISNHKPLSLSVLQNQFTQLANHLPAGIEVIQHPLETYQTLNGPEEEAAHG